MDRFDGLVVAGVLTGATGLAMLSIPLALIALGLAMVAGGVVGALAWARGQSAGGQQ